MAPYKADFPVGSMVRIADTADLETFQGTWKFHHPIQPEQLEYAGKSAKVEKVGFYHGGDVLYWLQGVLGVWHEACLRSAADE